MEEVVVVSDWDADGIVAAAEIVYAQEFLGLYPVKGKAKVKLVPSTPRTFGDSVKSVVGRVLVVLDIAFSRIVELSLREARKSFDRIIYIDHHLSTMVRSASLENLVDDLLVGRAPTAVLVAHVIKSVGGRLSPRLNAFVSAISMAEKGGVAKIDKRIVDIAIRMSKYLSIRKDRDAWESIVRWLASPISMTAMPFYRSIHDLVNSDAIREETRRVRAIAMELAPSALKLANIRLVDARKVSDVKLSALASQLYKILRLPVVVLGSRGDRVLIVVRSRDDLPQRLALKLYEMGVLKDVGGHQSLAIGVVDPKYCDLYKLREVILRALIEVERRSSS